MFSVKHWEKDCWRSGAGRQKKPDPDPTLKKQPGFGSDLTKFNLNFFRNKYIIRMDQVRACGVT